MIGGGAIEEPWLGLAAVADRPIRGLAVGRMMRTDVDAVQVGAFVLEPCDERCVHRGQNFLREVSTSQARLVGHDEGRDAGLVQAADRLR